MRRSTRLMPKPTSELETVISFEFVSLIQIPRSQLMFRDWLNTCHKTYDKEVTLLEPSPKQESHALVKGRKETVWLLHSSLSMNESAGVGRVQGNPRQRTDYSGAIHANDQFHSSFVFFF